MTTLAADTDLPDVAVLSDLSDLWPHLNSEHDWDVKTPDTGLAELERGARDLLTFFQILTQLRAKHVKLLYTGTSLITPPNSEIICGQNVGTKVVCGMILFFEKKTMLKI